MPKPIASRRALLLAGAAGTFLAAPALGYPTKPVRLLIPNPPGGANDIFGRLIAAHIQGATGQNVIAENRSGAAGLIAVNAVAKSEADGHTIGLISSSFTGAVAVAARLSFDPLADLTYLGMLGSAPMVLVVRRDFPAASPAEFVQRVRAAPGRFTYTSGGIGSIGHMATVLLERRLDLSMLHVPFRGLGQALAEMFAGRIDALVSSPASVLGHIRDGRIKALGTTGTGRAAVLPELPTLREAGLDYDIDLWWGLLGPSGMPLAAQQRMSALIAEGLRSPELAAAIRQEGAEPVGMELDRFNPFVREELRRWKELAAAADIRAE